MKKQFMTDYDLTGKLGGFLMVTGSLLFLFGLLLPSHTEAAEVEDATPPLNIVAAAGPGGGPHVTVWNASGSLVGSFMAYGEDFRGGVIAKIGDIDGDGVGEIVTVPAESGGPQVRAFEQDGTFLGDVWPYAADFRGGVDIALGDIDGDGKDEVITAPKSQSAGHIRTYNFSASQGFGLHSEFTAYNGSFSSGVNVEASDVTGDDVAEVVTVPMPGAPAHIRIFNETGGVVGQFYAYNEHFTGGANITFSDADRDGDTDLVIAPMFGGPQLRIMDGGGSVIYQEFLWNSNWRMGFTAAIDDTWPGSHMHVIAIPSSGYGAQMRVWDIDPGRHSPYSQYFAYTENFRGGASLVVADLDGDGLMEAVTAPGAGGGPHIRVFQHGNSGEQELNFMSHAPGFRGGVTIAVGR